MTKSESNPKSEGRSFQRRDAKGAEGRGAAKLHPKRFGLRREAQRHAAFEEPAGRPKSGIAASLCHRTPKRLRCATIRAYCGAESNFSLRPSGFGLLSDFVIRASDFPPHVPPP
jgi:hypothetical protein